jgi:hypothetical protein
MISLALEESGPQIKAFAYTGISANVRKDKRAEWERIANQAQNFFKHADRDPLGKFDFEPEITQFFLFDAVSLYAQMTNQPFLEGTVCLSWFTVKYDHFLVAGAFKDYISTIKQRGLDPDDFNFIQLFLQQSATQYVIQPDLSVR